MALWNLGKQKGYELVGCDSKGVNAFFVQENLATMAGFKILTPVVQAYKLHFRRTRKRTREEQFKFVEGLPFVEV